jgi:hypothetical protein
MSTNLNSAKQFFEACETGKGHSVTLKPHSLRKQQSCLKYPL